MLLTAVSFARAVERQVGMQYTAHGTCQLMTADTQSSTHVFVAVILSSAAACRYQSPVHRRPLTCHSVRFFFNQRFAFAIALG